MLGQLSLRAWRRSQPLCRLASSQSGAHTQEGSSAVTQAPPSAPSPPLQRWQQKTSHYGPLDTTPQEVVHTCQTAEEAEYEIHAAKFEPGDVFKEMTRRHQRQSSSVLEMFRLPESFLAVSNVQLFRSILLQNSDYLQKRVDEWCVEFEKEDQSLLPARHKAVGPELAAAHFLIHRGGAVRFLGQQRWESRDEDGDYDIPGFFDPQYKVVEVDISGFKNMALEGFENLAHLKYLENIILRGHPRVNNWYIDTICCQHSSSLRRIDMSHCPLLTVEAVTALGRLPLLEEANLEGLNISELELQLACLQLLEERPHLRLLGVQGISGLDLLES